MSKPAPVQPVSSAGPGPAASSASPSLGPGLSIPAGLAAGLGILLVACGSVRFFYSRGLTGLYGDAIAHMEGARRLTDSLTPGLEEIGSVWLPLYHLLVAPLARNDHLWRTGLGGSLVSAAAFALAAWFVFRLGLAMNGNLAAGVVALTGFLGCADMLYVASTPLTESLSVLWAVLVVWGLFRFAETGSRRALVGAALAAFCGTLTRYDGWYLLPFAALFVLLARRRGWPKRLGDAALFSVIAGAGPILWVVHNLLRYGNALEFYNGPFSAQAIYAHQLATTGFRYPTDASFLLSARYYLEDMKLVIGPASLELALLGLVAWAADAAERARRAAAVLLFVPFLFYVQSLASASVPLYVPTLFPHTYYNLRYGLEMLPAAAIFPSFLLSPRLPDAARRALAVLIVALLAVQFAFAARKGVGALVTVKESLLNTPCQLQTEQALVRLWRQAYEGGIILMSMGKYPCVAPTVGIPYRRTLTEMNRRYWSLLRFGPVAWPPGSPLTAPAWIVRGDGDPVDELIRAYPNAFRDFVLRETYKFPGEESVRVYQRQQYRTPPAGLGQAGAGSAPSLEQR